MLTREDTPTYLGNRATYIYTTAISSLLKAKLEAKAPILYRPLIAALKEIITLGAAYYRHLRHAAKYIGIVIGKDEATLLRRLRTYYSRRHDLEKIKSKKGAYNWFRMK